MTYGVQITTPDVRTLPSVSSALICKICPPPACMTYPLNAIAQLAPNLHHTVSALEATKHSSPLLTKEECTLCLNICLSVSLPARLLQEPWTFFQTFHTGRLIKSHRPLQTGLYSGRTAGSLLAVLVNMTGSGGVIALLLKQHGK